MKRSSSSSLSFVLILAGAALSGCGGAGNTKLTIPPPVTPPAPTVNPAVTATSIYSIDLAAQSVDVYAANLNGTASPSTSYPGGALAVTGDSAGNLYIGTYSSTTAAIEVYPAKSMTPSRSITVATATVNAPQITTLAVDSVGNVYAAVQGTIYVYGPTASGMAVPIRTITGALTLLSSIEQMAFDAENNLFVANQVGVGGQVIEFAAGATGNVAPTVVISGDYNPAGVALDPAGNIYICQGNPFNPSQGSYTAGVYVFAKGSVAGAKPTRVITGNNVGIVLYTNEIFLDSAGNIFVGITANGQNDYNVYSATATGNAAPSSTLIRAKGSTTDFQFYVR